MCCFCSSRRRHTTYWRDWSSDVCSSDLFGQLVERLAHELLEVLVAERVEVEEVHLVRLGRGARLRQPLGALDHAVELLQIGRASCREECRSRWPQYH